MKAGGFAMLFELPFASAEGWLDVRQGHATASQAIKKGGIKVGVAGVSGFVIGGAAFAFSAAVSVPIAIGAASALGAVGLYSTGKRSWNIAQRFRNRNVKALLPSKKPELRLLSLTANGLPLPQVQQPVHWLEAA